MPISSQELKDLLAESKRLGQIIEGLVNKAEAEEQHPPVEGQPAARLNRLR